MLRHITLSNYCSPACRVVELLQVKALTLSCIYICCVCVGVSLKNNVPYEAKCDIVEEAEVAPIFDANSVCP